MLISLEGCDEVGKTTQISLITEYLKSKKILFASFREPGGTEVAEKIRNLIKDTYLEASDISKLLLFYAARFELLQMSIIPAIKNNRIVICDRYIDSTTAYQHYGHGIDLEVINQLNKICKVIYPDLVILIDVNIDTLKQRLAKSTDSKEIISIEFQSKVRNGYFAIMKNKPSVMKMVDGNQSIDNVFKDIKNIIDDKIFKPN